MDYIALKDALNRHVTANEPPLRLTSAAVLAAGRRSRRRQVGAAGMVSAALAVTGVLAAWQLLPPTQPTGDRLVIGPECDVATLAVPDEDASRRTRVTCFLTRELASRLPEARFAALYGPAGAPPLKTYPDDQVPGGLAADAVVIDRAGAGSVHFVVAPNDPDGLGPVGAALPPTAAECAAQEICGLRTGPHGETIAVYTTRSEDGLLAYTLYVYDGRDRGGSFIVASSANTRAPGGSGHAEPSRPLPPLGVADLIEIATAPELAVFS